MRIAKSTLYAVERPIVGMNAVGQQIETYTTIGSIRAVLDEMNYTTLLDNPIALDKTLVLRIYSKPPLVERGDRLVSGETVFRVLQAINSYAIVEVV